MTEPTYFRGDELPPYVMMGAIFIVEYKATFILVGSDGNVHRISSNIVPLDDLSPMERQALTDFNQQKTKEDEDYGNQFDDDSPWN